MSNNPPGGKPVVIKTYGYFEAIGHTTHPDYADHVFRQACPSMREADVRIIEKSVRLDGVQRDAYLVERVA